MKKKLRLKSVAKFGNMSNRIRSMSDVNGNGVNKTKYSIINFKNKSFSKLQKALSLDHLNTASGTKEESNTNTDKPRSPVGNLNEYYTNNYNVNGLKTRQFEMLDTIQTANGLYIEISLFVRLFCNLLFYLILTYNLRLVCAIN